jgi:predicted dehydrogenase
VTTVGVVGLGHWGSKVVDEYVALREEGVIDGVVACDEDDGRLAAVNEVDDRVKDLNATIDHVDGVHLCTPIGTHGPLGQTVLESNTDLLVEKPFTADPDSSFRLLQTAMRENRILQTGHIYRFANVMDRLRDLHRTGRFGTLEEITVRWTHNIAPPSGTDVLWDLAPHPIDILNYITGDWPSDEYCRTRTRPTADGPTAATAQFETAGADVRMDVSWDDHVRRRDVELCGTDASALVEAVEQEITVYDEGGVHGVAVERNNTIRREARNFVDAIETRRNTANSAVVGIRTVEAIDRLVEVADRE